MLETDEGKGCFAFLCEPMGATSSNSRSTCNLLFKLSDSLHTLFILLLVIAINIVQAGVGD